MSRRRAAHRAAARQRHTARCASCKARFEPTRAGHVYCSARCRQNAHAARMRAQVGALPPPLVLLPRRTGATCRYCGEAFKRSNARQVYCSSSCRSRMSAARRRAAAAVLVEAYAMPIDRAADVLDVKGLAAVRTVLERAGWHFDEAARRYLRTDTDELAV